MDAYTYGYHMGSERTNVIRTLGDYVNYTYDGIGQLTNAVGGGKSGDVMVATPDGVHLVTSVAKEMSDCCGVAKAQRMS